VQIARKKTKWETATGILETKGTTTIENCRLPQFTKNCAVSSTFHLFDKRSADKYDVILGRDLLQAIGMDIHYSTNQFVWDNISINMVPSGYWTKDKISSVAKTWNQREEIKLTEILPAAYQPTDVSTIAKQQTHLTSEEQSQLNNVLLDFQDLFLGQCGKFTGEPVTLELIPDANPFYAKPFAIPRAYEQTTKNEIKRLESLGILTQVKASRWAAPTFIIPKKDNTVRVITDFRGLNKCLVRKPYPIPKIPDIFRGMEKFRFATTIDLNMGYYSMPLAEESKQLCVISLPWGLYRYEVLPQGIKPATDIFQQRMNSLYYDMDNVDTFLDDTIVLGHSTFDDHLKDVIEVLKRLLAAGMQVNVAKCKWFQDSVTYLGFIITREGIKPQPEKIQGILHMQRPTTQKQVRRFVGMVNFYRDLYPKRAELLAPLTTLCGQKQKFFWGNEHEDAFKKVKQQIAQETMLTYPQFDQPFIVYTDASEKQIGGVVTQDNKPLGFFSRKLTDTQRRYPVTEQEILAITETLKYFKHMLFGHKITVRTDHKNLTHQLSTHSSDRVLRQRLLLEEYGVELEYIEGEKNVVADALSRLPTEEIFTFDAAVDYPLHLETLAMKQATDDFLAIALQHQPPAYVATKKEGHTIYVCQTTAAIYVPASLRAALLEWYHTNLQHPGIKRMQATVKTNFYWPGIDAAITKLVQTCDVCQQCKITAVKKYGKIPLPAHHKLSPWEEVHVDLIGPWDVRYNSSATPGKSTVEKIMALTIMDKATGWPEFVAIKNKTSYHISILFDSEWLCRYPRPAKVVFDNGTEFTGQEFQELLESYGIKAVPTTVRNPRSNGIIERVHLTMGDMIRTMTFSGSDWFSDMQRALDSVAWAVRTTVNPTIKHSPCHLAFSQDMIFRQAVKIDWDNIHNARLKTLAASNTKENKTRIPIQYAPGDKILIVLDSDERRGQPKMNKPTKGPFIVTKVHHNGTVEINRGHFHETINIRRIKPFTSSN